MLSCSWDLFLMSRCYIAHTTGHFAMSWWSFGDLIWFRLFNLGLQLINFLVEFVLSCAAGVVVWSRYKLLISEEWFCIQHMYALMFNSNGWRIAFIYMGPFNIGLYNDVFGSYCTTRLGHCICLVLLLYYLIS